MPKAKVSILRGIPFFKDFTDEELEELEPHITIKYFKAKRLVRKYAGLDLHLHIIRSGEVEVIKSYGTRYEMRLATLKKNDFFGDMAFLSDSKHGATVVATKDTSTMSISLGLLVGYERHWPEIVMKFYHQFLLKMITRVRTMNERLEMLERRKESRRPKKAGVQKKSAGPAAGKKKKKKFKIRKR
ncbi:MAG: cyclic nucleotide-binding domain-containing protein [Acidobacteriota bacterium]|nr:MAG: cyclic nucleotide-binding domain-containing protein [Acidobacteriota bacterium]